MIKNKPDTRHISARNDFGNRRENKTTEYEFPIVVHEYKVEYNVFAVEERRSNCLSKYLRYNMEQ